MRKISKKALPLILALVMCLSLAVPAFAADTPQDVDACTYEDTWVDYGDRLISDSKLTINGVIGTETITLEHFYDGIIFDVVVGGGYTLDMSWPAGRSRFYNTYVDAALVNGELLDEDPVAGRLIEAGGWFNSYDLTQNQYVLTCTEDMVSKPGEDRLYHFWLDWGDSPVDAEYAENYGNVHFWLRVHPAQPTDPATPSFTDVPAGQYYTEPVAWAVEQGITTGTTNTTFSPSSPCTTAQILTFLWRNAGRPGATSANMAWSDELPVISNWARSKGMTLPADLNTTCTRASAVTYMWRAAGSPEPRILLAFNDVPVTADYAKAASWALEMGIANGTSAGTFSPNSGCNRGQIVTFLYRQMVEPIETVIPLLSPDGSKIYSTDPGVTLTLYDHYVYARSWNSSSFTVTGINYSMDWYHAHGAPVSITWTADRPGLVSLEERTIVDGVSRQLVITGETVGQVKITCRVTAEDGYVAEAYCYIDVRTR